MCDWFKQLIPFIQFWALVNNLLSGDTIDVFFDYIYPKIDGRKTADENRQGKQAHT